MTRFQDFLPAVIGLASNVRGGPNPPFGVADFFAMYPQFFTPADNTTDPEETDEPDEPDTSGTSGEPATTPPATAEEEPCEIPAPLIPMVMLQAYIDLAHACVKYSRFREAWKICMGLFIAHFITLYLKTMVDPEGDASIVSDAGMASGITSSKSVDSVSVSYDTSAITNDLEGWAGWKETEFGIQLATFAKMFSMGGIFVR